MKRDITSTPLIIGEPWSLHDVLAVAHRKKEIVLSDDPQWCEEMNASTAFLEQLWQKEEVIYGVTTGYGDSCGRSVPFSLVEELPAQLARYHGCGLGRFLSPEEGRAVLAVRTVSLSHPYSGVRLELLQRLVDLLNEDIIPVIPAEGSVGASGDLTPLSYVAAVIMGERDVYWDGAIHPTAEVLAKVGLEPISLRPKEALALMNGTAVMTALACMAYDRAAYLSQLSCRLTALAVEALEANRKHFSQRLFEAKPFPGQMECAGWIRGDLEHRKDPPVPERLQATYSIRCAPHVIGVLRDALPWMKSHIEIELNSSNDNPLVDAECGEILHGGHFYGGHIAFVMDSLKNAVANLADLMDRQLALLVDERFNSGLPSNLSGAQGVRLTVNHGFKAVQIAVSAWTAEALKLTMPASVFSRSTECHNQDKVSMGTIAARDGLRVLELTEQVAASLLLALAQAIALRKREGRLAEDDLNASIQEMLQSLAESFPFLEEDRALDATLREMVRRIQSQDWKLYEPKKG